MTDIRKGKHQSYRGFALIAVLLASTAIPAQATTIDFLIFEPTPGTIFYSGGTDPLVGLDIVVDAIVGNGTPDNSGSFATCVSCALSFATGPFIGPTADGWVFDGGGVIAVTGGVDLTGNGSAGDAGDIPEGSVLLGGTFLDFPLVADLDPTSGIIGGVTVGAALDFKNPLLTDFYGVPFGTYSSEMILTFSAAGDVPGAFVSVAVGNGVLSNDVPEPATLAFLGLGLCAAARLGRKRPHA